MTEPVEDAKPIFIGGLMMSGTSLARKLLGRHSRLFAGLETHWFSEEFRTTWRDPDSRRQRWMCEFFEVEPAHADELRRQSENAFEYFARFMSHCTARAGKQRWVEKTPDNIRHTDLIRERWPEARVVHVVRDYRDVCASWKVNRKQPVDEFIAAAQENVDALGGTLGTSSDWYSEVRYEDLVTRPEATLRSLCGFIGERFEPAMAEYEGDGDEHEKILRVTGVDSTTARSLGRPIFTDSIGRWRKALTELEVSRIAEHLGEPMRTWGML